MTPQSHLLTAGVLANALRLRGAGWLGLPATNVLLELCVMDIWRRDDNLLRENWVAIDIIHMLRQMGLDVFEQMRLQVRAR